MRKALSFVFAIFIAFAVFVPPSSRAGDALTLDVDLSKMYNVDFPSFIRAVVPEVSGGKSEKPMELKKLLHIRDFVQSTFTAEHRDPVFVQAAMLTLERLIRESVEKLDFATLRRMALGDGKTSGGNSMFLAPMFQKMIESEVAKVVASPKWKPVFPEHAPPFVEDFPMTYSPEDTLMLRRAAGPFLALQGKVDAQSKRKKTDDGLSKLAESFWKKPERKVAEALAGVRWSGDCGMGMDAFEIERASMMFIGFLRENRIAEALGASFLVPMTPEWMREPNRPFEQWRIDLLKSCGFDWEAVMLGHSSGQSLLAAHGSERGAKRLIDVVKTSAEQGGQIFRVAQLAEYLIPGAPSEWQDADPRKAMSAELQAEIFRTLDGALPDDADFDSLDQMMKIFERLRRQETKPTMLRLLGHPSAALAGRATRVLRAIGEDVADVVPAPDVRFRVFLNDKPWRSATLHYSMVSKEAKPFAASGVLKTDAEGFTSIPRCDFVILGRKGEKLGFSRNASGGSVMSEQIYGEAWVQADVDLPTAFDETTNVKLIAVSLPIEIAYATQTVASKDFPVSICLKKAGESSPFVEGYRLQYDQAISPPERLLLQSIGPGNYVIEIEAEGAPVHVTPPFEVKVGMEPVRVKLAKSTAIVASVSIPWNSRGAFDYALFRGDEALGEQFRVPGNDARAPLFRGLPVGRYRLRLLSTAEFIAKWKIKTWEPSEDSRIDLRGGVDCEGLDVEFVIDDNTPAILDLGRIENKAAAGMQGRAGSMKIIRGKGAPD